jgi:hypothetical protein
LARRPSSGGQTGRGQVRGLRRAELAAHALEERRRQRRSRHPEGSLGLAELLDLLDEAVDRVEVAVDRQEADVGDVVEALEEVERAPADLLARDLGHLHLVLEAVRELAQLLLGDRALVAGDPQLVEQLVGVEGLEAPGALAHHQRLELRALVAGEAAVARAALAPAADRRALVRRA